MVLTTGTVIVIYYIIYIEYYMPVISDIEAAVLGLICQSPRYGYELEKLIEERGMRNWTEIGFSSIYYVLKRLEKRELVCGKVDSGKEGRPARRTYEVTEKGRAAMREKMRNVLSERIRSKDPFDLGIAYYGLLKPEEFRECLDLYMEGVDERIRMLEGRIEEMREKKAPYHVIALFERPLVHEKAEREWATAFRERVNDLYSWKVGDLRV